MKRKRKSVKDPHSHCGEVHPDDGVDPAEFFRPTRGRERDKDHRKAQQLCHQVAETLSWVLNGELGAELDELRVVAVRPGADISQMVVLVAPALADSQIDPAAALARLAAVEGRLRAEVARSITRRRAPKLAFQFVADLSGDRSVQEPRS